MHDPQTLAHSIKYPWYVNKPWPKRFRCDPDKWSMDRAWKKMGEEGLQDGRCRSWPEGYRSSFIDIWHVDPAKRGSDDSCGYSFVRISPKQLESLKNAAWHEGHNKHFLRCEAREWNGTIQEAECLYRAMALLVARVLRVKLSWGQASMLAWENVHNCDCGKAGGYFCFLPGYHTNSEKDTPEQRQDHFTGILCSVARQMLTNLRPWYRHPKWHFWHWKFQVHPLQSFKRWAFSRCNKCGGKFEWGESPVTHQWDSNGPSWFGERDVMHQQCSHVDPIAKPVNN